MQENQNKSKDSNEWSELFSTDGHNKQEKEIQVDQGDQNQPNKPTEERSPFTSNSQEQTQRASGHQDSQPTEPGSHFNSFASQQAPNTSSPQPPQKDEKHHSSAASVVLQWLTYGLWIGTLTSLSTLITAALSYYLLDNNEDYTFMIYVLAVTICLLPLALVADRFYSKNEPDQKHGFAAVVMVIHAVIAFLVAIGALITAVVTLLSIAIDAGSTDEKFVVIASSLVVSFLGTLFFIRVMKPAKLRLITRSFPLIAVLITGTAIILTLAGPFKESIETRDDRLIESGLPGVNEAIQAYARKNSSLPDSLNQLNFSSYRSDAKALVERDLVRYKIEKAEQPHTQFDGSQLDKINPSGIDPYYSPPYQNTDVLNYELCVTYKKAKNDDSGYEPYGPYHSKQRQSYLSTYRHGAGEECYDMQTYTY